MSAPYSLLALLIDTFDASPDVSPDEAICLVQDRMATQLADL